MPVPRDEAPMTRQEWIAAFARVADVAEPSAQEAKMLLELAGVAAHASERAAAPLACWVAARSDFPLRQLLADAKRVAPPRGDGAAGRDAAS
jgi:hypothetical protein